MAKLVLVAYLPDDPLGTPAGTLTSAYDASVTVEDDGIGAGSFAIHPDDEGAAWCEQDAYVAVYRDTVAGDSIAGFWIDTIATVVLSPDEGGGRELRVAGRGPIAVLEEAVVWHRAVSGTSRTVRPAKGDWYWTDAPPARPLVRLLEEAQARGCLPAVGWDFSRTADSDGEPWATDVAETFSLPIGSDLLAVVRILRESGLHVVMGADLVLHAWDTHGRDLSGSVGFTAGVDIRDTAEAAAAARRGRSHVLLAGADEDEEPRYRAVGDEDIEISLGRRKEGFFRYERTATRAVLTKVGQRKLRRWKRQHDGPFTLGVLDSPGQVALVDYGVGDTVAVPTSFAPSGTERIAAITLAETEDGGYEVTLELGDLAPDPVTGSTPSGDVEGAGCCGDAPGVGKTPATGGGSSRSAPVDATEYVLDDFARLVPVGAPSSLVAARADVDAYQGVTGIPSEVTHLVALPAGIVAGDLCLVSLSMSQCFLDAGDVPAGWTLADSFQLYSEGQQTGEAHLLRVLEGDEVSVAIPLGVGGSYDPDEATVTTHLTVWRGVTDHAVIQRHDGSGDLAWSWDGGARLVDVQRTSLGPGTVLLETADPILRTTTAWDDDSPAPPGDRFLLALDLDDVDDTQDGGGWGQLPAGGPAPWAGGNRWVTDNLSDMTAAVDGSAGLLTANDDGAVAVMSLYSASDSNGSDEPWGPWADGEVMLLLRFRANVLGDPADPSGNTIALRLDTPGGVHTVWVHLGDDVAYPWMDPAGQRGLALVTGDDEASVFAPVAIVADTPTFLRLDARGTALRARLWTEGEPEPVTWDVVLAKDPLPGSDAALLLVAEANAGMVYGIGEIRAALGTLPGGVLGRHTFALGDGSTTTFDLGTPYEPGSLAVWVDGLPVPIASTDPAAGTFTLASAPYGDPADPAGSSVIEASYEVA